MNSLQVILTVIIILSILYLYFRNKQYNNILESFDNNSQSALSTYFQNTVDSDSYATNTNKYHMINSSDIKDNKLSRWDGIWENKSLNIYAQFIHNNDNVIISLSNSSFERITSTLKNTIPDSPNQPLSCTPNSFVGICRLSNDLLTFNLIEVLCNNYINTDLNLTVNNFSGKIVNENINLYSVGKGSVIVLNPKDKFSYYNNYAKNISPSTVLYPTIPISEFVYDEDVCVDSEPCIDNTHGLNSTTFNNFEFNACGKKISSTNKKCNGNPSCVFYSPAPDGMKTCSFSSTIYDYMNFAALSPQSKYTGNSLLSCNFLDYFNPSKCNSCIICYVKNIREVYTLNYEFFGTLPGESNLTTQSDMMASILNNPGKSSGLLNFYREAIKNNTAKNDVFNGLSLTNCIENSSDTLNNAQISNCVNTVKDFISNPKNQTNPKLFPCVWQINQIPTKNILNSCPVILSTNQNYDTPIKYAEFNKDGTTSLSLYSGGLNQHLIFEKVNILKESSVIPSQPYVAMSANLKTNDGLYLIPTSDNDGFSNSNIIRLKNKPSLNGKWLIIGFTLNNLRNLKQIIDNINF